MHKHIQPIETIYNGYRFRSRLEARWAVFFDALHWRYEYEPEGFTWHGEKYLPDFALHLDDSKCPIYLEVKPLNPGDEQINAALEKWIKFSMHIVDPIKAASVIVFGDPWIDMNAATCFYTNKHRGGEVMLDVFLMQCPCCTAKGRTGLAAIDKSVKMKIWNAPKFDRRPYKAARQARFEHGESPRT